MGKEKMTIFLIPIGPCIRQSPASHCTGAGSIPGSLCGICSRQTGTRSGFPLSNLVSPVSIILPMIHNNSFLCH